MMSNTLRTTLVWDDADVSHVVEAIVSYSVSPGYAETREQPGEETHVEITGIAANGPVPAHFVNEHDLLVECLADWRDDQIAGEEYRAEQRAEQNRDERNQWERLA